MNEIILLTITTSLGSFDIELYQKEAPITANNFVEYVEQNFYENTLFHRVIPGFVIQGGGFEIGMSPKKTNPPIKNEADKWKLYLDQMWVNYQNQHEFNPVHNHGGVYSFAAWLKIPTDHQEQQEIYNAKDANGGLNSAFCFHYTDSLGNIRTTIYPQRPDMEGTLLFFPSKLNHEVYPYYECDEQRISISGNLWLRE